MSYDQAWLPILKVDPKAFSGLPPEGPGGYDMAAVMANTPSAQVVGLYSITPTTFDGTEVTFPLAKGWIDIGLFSPVQSKIRPSAGPFMAALPARADYIGDSPVYRHHPEFIPVSAVMPSYRWINTQPVQDLVVTPGALIYGLQNAIGLDTAITNALPASPTIDTPLAVTWEAVVPFSNAPALQYFDFNWVQLFNLSTPTTEPAMITVASNPSGLAASVLAGAQVLLDTIVYNTIRITKLPGGALAAGAYPFTFSIYDKLGNAAVTATLNLTVV